MKNVFDILQATRISVGTVAKTLTLDQLNEVPSGFNNNIIWNLGHIVCVQQQLVYGLSGVPLVVGEFITSNFRNKTKPERPYIQEEVDLIFEYLTTTILIMEEDYNAGKLANVNPFISKTMNKPLDKVEDIIVFNLYHEGLHTGVIQKYMQKV